MKTAITLALILALSLLLMHFLTNSLKTPNPTDPLVAKGRELFFKETFGGNGRTCGTCHPAENNFTLDPVFISGLPDNDPLFVAEFDPNLSSNFENPRLLREFGLILENLDGFNDLSRHFTMRGIPHTLALGTSVNSVSGAHTGWSGDGAPGDGSVRSFSTGAVIQHFTKSLNRIPGVDFRLPSIQELDALEAFMLSLGRQQDLQVPLPFINSSALMGQAIFNDVNRGKCFICHSNAGANVDSTFFGSVGGNLNFNTGIENLPIQPARLSGVWIPFDDGFGTPGDSTFNTPPLVEAAETAPFFHNNAIATLEGAVAFYDGETFNQSPAGQVLLALTGSEIKLEATEIEAIATFLRVLNALENIRQGIAFLDSYLTGNFIGNEAFDALPDRAADEIRDAIGVLVEGNLQPTTIVHLNNALAHIETFRHSYFRATKFLKKAKQELSLARDTIITK